MGVIQPIVPHDQPTCRDQKEWWESSQTARRNIFHCDGHTHITDRMSHREAGAGQDPVKFGEWNIGSIARIGEITDALLKRKECCM